MPKASTQPELFQAIMGSLRRQLGGRIDQYLIPPPIFAFMQGEFIDYDAENARLVTRFPVRSAYLNPYGIVQGGMVTAAVDNTLGPLSMLVAPPNVTRRLEMKFSRPASKELEYMQVTGHLVQLDHPWMHLRAEVRDPGGGLLAKARATHWIVGKQSRDELGSQEAGL
jgi:acyl-coenzyme A thioesterase PaaI-like protein